MSKSMEITNLLVHISLLKLQTRLNVRLSLPGF